MTTTQALERVKRLLSTCLITAIALTAVLAERVIIPAAKAAYAWLSDPENQAMLKAKAASAYQALRAAYSWAAEHIDWAEITAVISAGAKAAIDLTYQGGVAFGQALHGLNNQLAQLASSRFKASNAIAWFSSERFCEELSADQIELLEEIHDYQLAVAMSQPCPF